MVLIEERKIDEMKDDWNRLISANANSSPFHEYDFACILKKAYNYYPYFIEKPVFYVFIEDGIVNMIAPLCRHKGKDGDYYVSFGAMFRVCFEDFIYSDDMTEEQLNEYIKLLLNKLNSKINFDFVSESCLLYRVLNNRFAPTRDELCVGIALPENYTEYFDHHIHSQLRTNLKRAYKSLTDDNAEYHFVYESGKQIDKKTYRDSLNVYIQRHGYKGRNFFKRFYFNWFNRKHHHNAVAIPNLNSGFLAVLYINGNAAATIGGYMQKNKKYIIVHRGAINDAYHKYMPGILLYNELIRKMIEEYKIHFLDLSKGNEPYKYIIGGKDFYQHCYCLTEENCGRG